MTETHVHPVSAAWGFAAADHSSCAHDPKRLSRPGAALTPSRRRVLDELCAAGGPLGAYDLIDRVAIVAGKRPAPMSVYRALDFLVDNGFVHRLASRNAFLACSQRHNESDAVAFLICERCGGVKEATSEDVSSSLASLALRAHFTPRRGAIELLGRCATCQGRDQQPASAQS